MPDSTSPDDLTSVSPPLMTTFVVPTVLARTLTRFLNSQGFTVARNPATPDEHTFVALPPADLVAALSDVTARYRVTYEEGEFGAQPRVVDTHARVDFPMPSQPPPPPSDLLPTFVRVRALPEAPLRCGTCWHRTASHASPDSDATVMLCRECECRTRLSTVALPEPVEDISALPVFETTVMDPSRCAGCGHTCAVHRLRDFRTRVIECEYVGCSCLTRSVPGTSG